jgi:hypothetical protein
VPEGKIKYIPNLLMKILLFELTQNVEGALLDFENFT